MTPLNYMHFQIVQVSICAPERMEGIALSMPGSVWGEPPRRIVPQEFLTMPQRPCIDPFSMFTVPRSPYGGGGAL